MAARETLRVAHVLEKLPQTCQAFASGELSYSMARAITRVGTEHSEACLVSYAWYGTASQLDKTVRLHSKQATPRQRCWRRPKPHRGPVAESRWTM